GACTRSTICSRDPCHRGDRGRRRYAFWISTTIFIARDVRGTDRRAGIAGRWPVRPVGLNGSAEHEERRVAHLPRRSARNQVLTAGTDQWLQLQQSADRVAIQD